MTSLFKSKMASLFGPSPFSSPVGQRIERATDGVLASEDWALNLEICDIINETDDGPKDAAKAIKKRLSNNKNFKSVILTLTVLESCVKNCGRRFHVLVAKKDFLDDLTKILSPKVNAPQVVQDKVLSLIQDWADAFRNSPDMGHFLQIYDALRTQGIEFPAKNLDTLSPIFTPERSQPERPSTAPAAALPPVNVYVPQSPIHGGTEFPALAPVPTPAPAPTQTLAMSGPINPSPEQLAKLRSELDIVQANVQVMSEMLTEMTPGQEEAGDLELLQELNRTCRAMQQRLLELLEQVANEEVVGELLRINDDVNNVFIRYDRYERFRQAQAKPAEPPRPSATTIPTMPPRPTFSQVAPQADAVTIQADAGSLISFDDAPDTHSQPIPSQATSYASTTNGVTSQMQGLDIKKTSQEQEMATSVAHDDEFDMFAQSRKSNFEESRKSGSTYTDNLQPYDRLIADSMSVDKSTPQTNRLTADSISVEKSTPQTNPPIAEIKASQPSPDCSAPGETAKPPSPAMESIEAWLGDEKDEEAAAPQPAETLSSQDFDEFLADRAASGGQRTGSVKSGSQRPKQRQMQMENKSEDEFFGL